MSTRICPNDIFTVAHNGLNMFLTEYPHMNEEQKAKIRQLVEHFSKPEFYRKKMRRPALFCRMGQDDAILITPKTTSKFMPVRDEELSTPGIYI